MKAINQAFSLEGVTETTISQRSGYLLKYTSLSAKEGANQETSITSIQDGGEAISVKDKTELYSQTTYPLSSQESH